MIDAIEWYLLSGIVFCAWAGVAAFARDATGVQAFEWLALPMLLWMGISVIGCAIGLPLVFIYKRVS